MNPTKQFTPPNLPQHVVHRDRQHQPCFFTDQDREVYLNALQKCAREFHISLHAFALLDNYIHLLITPKHAGGLSKMMDALSTVYGNYLNRTHDLDSKPWKGRYRSSQVNKPGYLMLSYRYIELKPVREGKAAAPEDFVWSSYRDNALGEKSVELTPHDVYLRLGECDATRAAAYRGLFPLDHQLPYAQLEVIRNALKRKSAIGELAD